MPLKMSFLPQRSPAGFHVRGATAVVADFRGRQHDELSGVRRIGDDLLITGHAGVENRFAGAVLRTAEPIPAENRAVRQRQKGVFLTFFPPKTIHIQYALSLFLSI